MKTIIGVDVGGTLLRAARYDLDWNILQREEQATLAAQGLQAVLGRLYDTIERVLPDDRSDVLGIGVACPGPLDAHTGLIIETPNLPFRNTPLRKLLEERLGVTTYVSNDADLAGLAEYTRGAGRGARTMIYMTISTGVGGGVVVDGKPLIAGGLAGEIGHMVVDPHGPMCGCGHRGHLEAIASGPSIARAARERIAAGEPSMISDMVGGQLAAVTGKTVGDAARLGDRLALEVVANAGKHIGVMIASLMALLNPDMFVLGGGVTKLGDLLFNPIHQAVREYTVHDRYWQGVPIVRAELGEDVGLVGGAALVRALQGI